MALKVAGVPTEMLRFPDEAHLAPLIGRTDRRIEWFKTICSWFDHYLAREQETGQDTAL